MGIEQKGPNDLRFRVIHKGGEGESETHTSVEDAFLLDLEAGKGDGGGNRTRELAALENQQMPDAAYFSHHSQQRQRLYDRKIRLELCKLL